jgi:sugar phosphate isomerase/epimerase
MKPKVGLYSVTYAGMWYDGPALTIKEFIARAKRFGVPGVELDCRVPHAVPYFLKPRDRQEIREYSAKEGIELSALAANNDFSSPVIEHRDANIQMVVDMIKLCKDLGAPVLRVFTAWAGSSHRDGLGTYEIARPSYERAFQEWTTTERWVYCLDAFKIVSKVAEEEGVILALQNHPPVVRYSEDCLWMIQEVNSPNFKMSFDISGERAWQNTESVLAQAKKIGKLWVHSHYGGDFKRNPDGTVVPIPLGRTLDPKGSLAWNTDAWVRAMHENNYGGYVNYEGCTPTYLPNGRYIPIETMDARVALGLEYMRSLIDQYDWSK